MLVSSGSCGGRQHLMAARATSTELKRENRQEWNEGDISRDGAGCRLRQTFRLGGNLAGFFA